MCRLWRALLLVVLIHYAVVALGQAPVLNDASIQIPPQNKQQDPLSAAQLVVVGPAIQSYIQFDLSLLPFGTSASQVSKASMKLYVSAISTPGVINVYQVGTPWTENTITGKNPPVLGRLTAPNVAVNAKAEYVIVDLTDTVKAWLSGTPNYGVALVPDATVSVAFDSKETSSSGRDAELNVVLVDAGPIGPVGPMGPPGAQGQMGLQGPQGPVGPAGDTRARMLISALFPGALTSSDWSGAHVVYDQPITLLRATGTTRTTSDPLCKPAVVRISDGSKGQDLLLGGSAKTFDTGPFSISFAAGTPLDVRLVTPENCPAGSASADASVQVHYKMSAGDADACPAGSQKCIGNVCHPLGADPDNCGVCGNSCGSGVCISGACATAHACTPPGSPPPASGYWADCDGNPANACESNLYSDPANCGICGNACTAGTTCLLPSLNGGQVSVPHCSGTTGCIYPLFQCAGTCVDPATDSGNCGACGHTCAAGQVCSNAACTACASGQTICSGACVNTATDAANCGTCGHACSSSQICQSGVCTVVPECSPGQTQLCRNQLGVCSGSTMVCGSNGQWPADCDYSKIPGYSTQEICDGLDNNCDGTVDEGGVCGVSCSAGFGDCDHNSSNGCETNLNTSATNCGACGNVCAAGTSCVAGQCVASSGCGTGPACAAGQACVAGACVCNSTSCSTGCCSGNTCVSGTTLTACGSSGNACMACTVSNGTPTCASGVCTIASCNAGFGDCDLKPGNGCETNLNGDNNNCGACGNVCGTGTTCQSGACVATGSAPSIPVLTSSSPLSPSQNSYPTIYGLTTANATVLIFSNDPTCNHLTPGTQIGSGAASSSGSFAIVATVPANATTSLYAMAQNAFGTSGCSAPLLFTNDNTPPASPANITVNAANTAFPVVQGTGEPGAVVRIFRADNYSIYGTGGVSPAGTFSVTFSTPAALGTFTYGVTLTDAVGNVSAPAFFTYTP